MATGDEYASRNSDRTGKLPPAHLGILSSHARRHLTPRHGERTVNIRLCRDDASRCGTAVRMTTRGECDKSQGTRHSERPFNSVSQRLPEVGHGAVDARSCVVDQAVSDPSSLA